MYFHPNVHKDIRNENRVLAEDQERECRLKPELPSPLHKHVVRSICRKPEQVCCLVLPRKAPQIRVGCFQDRHCTMTDDCISFAVAGSYKIVIKGISDIL